MSVLQSVAPKLQEAIEELQKIQFARRKARMALELGDGHARVTDSADNIMGETSGQIILQNINGNLELSVSNDLAVIRFPCNKIIWYHCINTIITFELEEFSAKKVILTVNSIHQVNRVIAHIKPPPKPRSLTYQHNELLQVRNRNTRTTDPLDYSFESDDPSSPENLFIFSQS